eukprot:6294155-Pyramimonas_sp.AAC.1
MSQASVLAAPAPAASSCDSPGPTPGGASRCWPTFRVDRGPGGPSPVRSGLRPRWAITRSHTFNSDLSGD